MTEPYGKEGAFEIRVGPGTGCDKGEGDPVVEHSEATRDADDEGQDSYYEEPELANPLRHALEALGYLDS